MNSRTRTLYLLSAMFLLASCVAGPRYEDHIERRWPAAGVKRLSIHEIDGSVDIQPASTGEISLSAHVLARGLAPDRKAENHGYFVSDLEGDTLSIGRKRGAHISWHLFGKNDYSVDYVLKVPPSVTLDVRTVNGPIVSHGIDGETQMVSVNGPIEVECSGVSEISAHTVNGPVKVKFLTMFQGASLKTVNGGVEATLPHAASFSCDLSQVNGDFEANFPLNTHSHPGNRRVSGEVNGGKYELKIVTVNGDIHLENGSGGNSQSPSTTQSSTQAQGTSSSRKE